MLKRFFTWWDGSTLGASFDIRRHSVAVGQDGEGNSYFEEKRALSGARKRRYVLYDGVAEASRIPPDWFGWLHHLIDVPPNVAALPRKAWEKPHQANLTGTPLAYHPPGSLARAQPAAPMDGYKAWSPDEAPDKDAV